MNDKLQEIRFTHHWLCFLKVLIWRTRASMFLMGKTQRRPHCLSACQTPPSLLLIPPRICAHPHSRRPRARRSSLLLSTRRSSYRPPLLPSRPAAPPSWSAACRRSGGCPSLAWTRVSYVSRGRRTAASFTEELDTSFPAMSAPGSWRRGTRCVRCAGCRSSRSSSPTSAETDRARVCTGHINMRVTASDDGCHRRHHRYGNGRTSFSFICTFALEDGKGLLVPCLWGSRLKTNNVWVPGENTESAHRFI